MELKRMIKTAAVMIIMVFAVSNITEYSYAYWATNVTVPADDSTVGDVGVGTWTMLTQWDANATYSIGDRVSNNGIIYEAKKNNPTKQPGVDTGWNSEWIQIG